MFLLLGISPNINWSCVDSITNICNTLCIIIPAIIICIRYTLRVLEIIISNYKENQGFLVYINNLTNHSVYIDKVYFQYYTQQGELKKVELDLDTDIDMGVNTTVHFINPGNYLFLRVDFGLMLSYVQNDNTQIDLDTTKKAYIVVYTNSKVKKRVKKIKFRE